MGAAGGRGAGRRAAAGGRGGRCHTPLFSLESASGGGRLKNAFLCGPKNVEGLAEGPRN